jgi:membrane associated rhomboid family serine protease
MWALLIIWVMFIIECIYTFITFGTLFGPSSIPAIILLKMGANNGLLVKLGQVHRLFMAIILHGGLLHIFFNTATLIAFCA